MKIIPRLIFSFFCNLAAFVIITNFIDGFSFSGTFIDLLYVVGIFTLINIFIKPIFTTILSPLIVLTFGLLSLLINAGMLYLLDFLNANVIITTTESLIYATLIVSIVNLILNFSAKSLFKSV